jgi:hypothetical protein
MNGDPPDWLVRLMHEREELNSKLHKLHGFLASREGQSLDETDRMLLGFQGMMMENYLSVLDVRLQRYQQGAGR